MVRGFKLIFKSKSIKSLQNQIHKIKNLILWIWTKLCCKNAKKCERFSLPKIIKDKFKKYFGNNLAIFSKTQSLGICLDAFCCGEALWHDTQAIEPPLRQRAF